MKGPAHITISPLLIILAGLLLTSCLNDAGQNDLNDRLTLTFNLNDADELITAEDDTISINLIRFLVGNNYLYNNMGDTLIINPNVYQLNHSTTDDASQELKVLVDNRPFTSEAIFNTLNFEIKKAEQIYSNNPDIDDEFTEDGGETADRRYSMIINGTYNGSPFTFKSIRNFEYTFPFPDYSDGTGGNLIYNLFVLTDVGSWFLNDDGTALLDPGNPSNASAINDNIETSIQLDL